MKSIRIHCLIAGVLACGAVAAAGPATEPAPATQPEKPAPAQFDRWVATKLVPQADGRLLLQGDVRQSTGPSTQPAPREVFVFTAPNDAVHQAVNLKWANELALEDARLGFPRDWANAADGTYLGVGVDAPDETLRSQLDLSPGAGLVVNYVDENGPAKAAVQAHDVLQKLDDQLLVNADQLVTLVRMHKPGEMVSLTLLRHAKPLTVQVALGHRNGSQGAADAQRWAVAVARADAGAGSVVIGAPANTPNRQLEIAEKNVQLHIDDPALPPWHPPIHVEERPITFNDGELLATLGKGELLAVDVRSGTVLYRGPIGTLQEWDALPQAVKDKLAAWRSLVLPEAKQPAPTAPQTGN